MRQRTAGWTCCSQSWTESLSGEEDSYNRENFVYLHVNFLSLFLLFRVSQTVLVQLMSLLPVNSERDTMRRAVSLCRALGEELDFSHIMLDERLCVALLQMLDSSEGFTKLDLSHCQLTDQLLLQLSPHLHKVHIVE